MRKAVCSLALIGALYAQPANADLAWDRKNCTQDSPVLEACSRLIASGRFAPNQVARFHLVRGGLYSHRGEIDKTLADFGAAIRLDPKLATAYEYRADIYWLLKRYEDAIRDKRDYLRLRPDDTAERDSLNSLIKLAAQPKSRAYAAPKPGTLFEYALTRDGKDAGRATLTVLPDASPHEGVPAYRMRLAIYPDPAEAPKLIIQVRERSTGLPLAILYLNGRLFRSFSYPKLTAYRWPFRVSENFLMQSVLRDAKGAKQEIPWIVEVESMERITVPAGTFSTVRMGYELEGLQSSKNWIVPERGIFVRRIENTDRGEQELKLVRIGNAAPGNAGLERAWQFCRGEQKPFDFIASMRACDGLIRFDLRDAKQKAQAHLMRARMQMNDDHWDEALEELEPALRLDPQLAGGLSLRARIRALKKNCPAALADADRALKAPGISKDDAVWAYIAQAWCFVEAKQIDRAIAASTAALRLTPDSARLYASRAELYEQQNRNREAIADYARAIARADANWKGVYCQRRGWLNIEIGEHDAAITDFTCSIRSKPKEAWAYYARADTYLAMKKYKEAVADATRAIQLTDRYTNAYVTRARARLALGERREALADANAALKSSANFTPALVVRGDVYRALGDRGRAAADYRKALALVRDPKTKIGKSRRVEVSKAAEAGLAGLGIKP